MFVSLLLSLIVLSDPLPAQGTRCSWSLVIEGTLIRRVEQCPYHFRAIRIGTEQVKGRQSTVFEITAIIKNPKDNDIRVGRKMKVWELAVPTVTGNLDRDTELAGSHLPGSEVIMVSQSGIPENASVLCEADERIEAYLFATAAALKGITDEKARIAVFVPYLESECEVVASDALDEVFSNGYEGLSAVRHRLTRELILQRIADPNAFPSQLGKYGMLAGLCGKPEDAALLEKKIVVLDADYRPGIEGVMVGYLLICGEDGLKVLEDARMRTKVAMNSDGKEVPLPFYETYAALQVLRFMWTDEPNRLPQERLKQSMRILLDRPELADLVITDLARWKDWSIQDRLMAMYDDETFDIPAIRRAIIRYLYYCSQDEGEPTVGGTTTTRPEHALKADANLKILGERDPKTVSAAMRYLRVVKAAPTDNQRPTPILANAERLERVADASSRGLMGCGTGCFMYIDHAGGKRRLQSGLDPIHVFGGEIDAMALSAFLRARAEANEMKSGEMYGQRRYLLIVILGVVALSEDAHFIDLLAPLLNDPIPEVQKSVQNALICIGDSDATRRKQILEMLSTHNWNPDEFRSTHGHWFPVNSKQGSKD